MGQANFFPDRTGPSHNLSSENTDRAKKKFHKIRTELKRAKKIRAKLVLAKI